MISFASASSEYTETTSNFTAPTASTVCFWCYINNDTTHRLFGYNVAYAVLRRSQDEFRNNLYVNANKDSNKYSTPRQWFLAFSANSSTGNASGYAYENGSLTQKWTSTGHTTVPSANTFRVADDSDGSVTDTLNGEVGDFRIYNRVLSDAEIQTIANANGRDAITHGLIHRWLFNEVTAGSTFSGSGQIKDHASGALNMTGVATPTGLESFLNWRG